MGNWSFVWLRCMAYPGQHYRIESMGELLMEQSPVGPKPYLAAAEEEELLMFIVDVAKAGYGKTRRQIKAITENVATEKGIL